MAIEEEYELTFILKVKRFAHPDTDQKYMAALHRVIELHLGSHAIVDFGILSPALVETDPETWEACPQHGPLCVGADCCCRDLHPEVVVTGKMKKK